MFTWQALDELGHLPRLFLMLPPEIELILVPTAFLFTQIWAQRKEEAGRRRQEDGDWLGFVPNCCRT